METRSTVHKATTALNGVLGWLPAPGVRERCACTVMVFAEYDVLRVIIATSGLLSTPDGTPNVKSSDRVESSMTSAVTALQSVEMLLDEYSTVLASAVTPIVPYVPSC